MSFTLSLAFIKKQIQREINKQANKQETLSDFKPHDHEFIAYKFKMHADLWIFIVVLQRLGGARVSQEVHTSEIQWLLV